jgi:2-amino-4-hydroxy-6-hydroxymethyldihydropteridine diphosphokinase
VRVAIALGSNLGDRESHLSFAVAALGRLLQNLTASSWIETDPVGVGVQPRFLNGAVAGHAALPARALLDELIRIEAERGRVRPHDAMRPSPRQETGPPQPAKLPRTLDLDLILYGDAVINDTGLVIPHPRFRERLFVLEPLAEVAGDWVDPVTGLTVSALRSRLARRRPS